MPLTSAEEAVSLARKYCHLDIRDEDVGTLDAAPDQRAAGIELAAQTLKSLAKVDGVRGVHLMTGEDFGLARQVLEASGLGRNPA